MWARIDDQVPDSRKFKKIHPSAAWLWTCGICYCNRYLTDGFIPADDVPTLSQNMTAAESRKYAEQLVKATLWDAADGGYRVHDYLDIYESASEVRASRLAAKLSKELYQNQGLPAAVRERDRDRCRYCGIAVNWKDKRGITGGVFVYLDKDKGNSISNIVVGCRACHTKVEDGQNLHIQPPPPDRREPIEKRQENQIGLKSESDKTQPDLNLSDSDLPISLPTYPTQSYPTQSDPILPNPTLSEPSRELLGKEQETHIGFLPLIVTGTNGTRRTEGEIRGDVAWENFKAAYPASRRQGGFMANQGFIAGCEKVGYTALMDALERHKRGDPWKRGFIPKLENWVRDELWIQEPDASVTDGKTEAERVRELVAENDKKRAAKEARS